MSIVGSRPKTQLLERPAVPAGFGFRAFVRRNIILVIPTLVFLALLYLAIVQIDRFNFSTQKGEIIRRLIEDRRLFNNDNRAEISALVDQYNRLTTEQTAARERTLELLEERMQALLVNNPFIWQIQYTDRNKQVLASVSIPERLEIQNDYSNSLFFRDFSKPLINIRESADRIPYGSIEILYASPKGIPEIELLTERWRWITLGIILLFLLAYAGLLFGLFLPTRRVLMALDKGGEIGARYIVPPRTLLERYYNNLARDATLSVLSTTMRGMIANDSTLEQDDLGDRIPLLICELFPFEEISLLNFQKSSDSGDFVLREVISTQGVLDLDRGTQTGDWHNQPRGLSQYLGDSAQQGRSAFLTRVVRRSDQQVIVLQLQANQLPAPQNPWWIAVFEQIAAEVAFVLEKRDAQRRLILQEKNKANISLSRNLGHDLTNIIATSKLELMTVKSFLSLPRETLLQSEPKKQIFQESLESLLNNTKFLQETVNLYRSFTYLSKPRFEEVNLNELVREVSQLFQLSLSRNIKIALQLENELPTLTVEPRLLRLALFNLLNNGADAIKLVSSVESPEGTLTLVTGLTKNPGVVRLEVIDSGSGIRDHSGRLLDEHEISAIFQLGYTTKEQGTGEGLGLNWVRQIVEDFHQGEIVAQNHPGGGALFRLLLPVHHEATKPHAPT